MLLVVVVGQDILLSSTMGHGRAIFLSLTGRILAKMPGDVKLSNLNLSLLIDVSDRIDDVGMAHQRDEFIKRDHRFSHHRHYLMAATTASRLRAE